VDEGDQVSGPPITLACFGLFGTAAQDDGMLERAFAEACATQGIVPGTTDYAHYMVAVHQTLGEPAVDVFRGLFPGNPGRAEAAALSFERSFRAAIDRQGLLPVPGAREALEGLRESGVRICMITGLSRRLLGIVLDTLGWWRLVDLALSPEDVPRGCPWPDQMLAAMLRLGVGDVQEAAYAGSTTSGIRCGKRSGARIVAGVLTGGHTQDRLREAGATHFITRITEFPALLAGAGTNVLVTGVAQARTPGTGIRPEAARRPGAGAPAGDVTGGGLAEGAARGPGPLTPPQASASQVARQVPP
jgi:phosphoglycolate phosphatase